MDALQKAIKTPKKAFTIADAATASGLSFYDTERGLLALVAEYRGELIPTEKGELLFRFPTGFSKPWETQEALDLVWRKIKKGALGVAKFVVRAWITIVMVGYVAIFAAILIALSFANKSDRDDRGGHSFGSMVMFDVLLRVILDSLFWTFHPFSPFNNNYGVPRRRDSGMPFYEKVNRFFFGPEEIPVDPLENKKRVLEEIRAKQGRIGLLDVLRVTGMTREQADPFIAALMLEYNGDVKVSEFGGITYSFPDLRKTTQTGSVATREPSWLRKKILPPLTGNEPGSNMLIAGLNGFNLFMSMVAIQNGWTIEKLGWILRGVPPHMMPMDFGAPLVLGWIPFWFSTVLFALPLIRWLVRPKAQAAVNRENGRKGLLLSVLNKLTGRGIREPVLEKAWEANAGVKPTQHELTREVIKLGGELELNQESGETLYRFKSLEAEVRALEKERAQAQHSERDVGSVVTF
jgi:hypothetical protein